MFQEGRFDLAIQLENAVIFELASEGADFNRWTQYGYNLGN